MEEKHLLILTLLAVVFGITMGVSLRFLDISSELQSLIAFPGEIFMQTLKLMILPLIFSSLISSLGQMDSRGSGKMGIVAVLYYLSTVIIASFIGVCVVLLIHPGNPAAKSNLIDDSPTQSKLSALDSLLDLIRNMFPQNIIEATMKRSQTTFVNVRKNVVRNNETAAAAVLMKKTVKLSQGTNILGLVVFCTGFGIVISKLGGKGKMVVEFFVVLDKVVMRFVSIVMWFAPVGIVSLISSSILDVDDLSKMLSTMTLYVLTVMICLVLHCIIAIPSMFFLLTRRNPWEVAKGMIQPFVTAIGTASSGASLPQAIHCVENNLAVDSRIAGFVMPLGNTINMDGNALYEAVAVIFIAQLNNISLNFADIITICVTATFASIGLNAVPAGLVSIFVILSAVDLPVSDISLLFTVDWLIDRVRTALNVLGDAYCACVVQHFLEDEIKRKTEQIEILDVNIEGGLVLHEDDPNDYPEEKTKPKKVSFADPAHRDFNKTKTYSLKSAIIEPLRAHVALQARLSQISEE